MTAIYKRELRSYFCSMIGYVFIAIAVLFIGIFFMVYNLQIGFQNFSLAIQGAAMVFTLIVPILTMRSFAEERRNKTDQMFLTYPVSVFSVVMGKFLSMMTVVAIPLLISCVCPIIINHYGTAHFLSDYSSILALFLLCAVFVSIGMFISSLTDNQIVAAILTFAALLVVYMWNTLIQYIPTQPSMSVLGLLILLAILLLVVHNMTKNNLLVIIIGIVGVVAILIAYLTNASAFEGLLTNWLTSLSCITALSNFCANSVFDISGLILYLSLTAMFIYLTVQSIQKRRWS